MQTISEAKNYLANDGYEESYSVVTKEYHVFLLYQL